MFSLLNSFSLTIITFCVLICSIIYVVKSVYQFFDWLFGLFDKDDE